jgi:hypothetical protein
MRDVEMIDGIATKTLLEPVPHYYVPVSITDDNPDLATLNRDIRNWCARNLDAGSWETQLDSNDQNETVVGVYIDLDQADYAMAVKLRWT